MKTFLCLALVAFSTCMVRAADWTTDYQAALTQAKAQHKNVLLDFTGSDWCPACKLLHEEVFPKPAFKDFADKHYILVTVDFPDQKELPDPLKKQNDDLQQKFGIDGFPTLLVVDPSGKEIGRETGYDPGSGADAVVSKLKTFK